MFAEIDTDGDGFLARGGDAFIQSRAARRRRPRFRWLPVGTGTRRRKRRFLSDTDKDGKLRRGVTC